MKFKLRPLRIPNWPGVWQPEVRMPNMSENKAVNLKKCPHEQRNTWKGKKILSNFARRIAHEKLILSQHILQLYQVVSVNVCSHSVFDRSIPEHIVIFFHCELAYRILHSSSGLKKWTNTQLLVLFWYWKGQIRKFTPFSACSWLLVMTRHQRWSQALVLWESLWTSRPVYDSCRFGAAYQVIIKLYTFSGTHCNVWFSIILSRAWPIPSARVSS